MHRDGRRRRRTDGRCRTESLGGCPECESRLSTSLASQPPSARRTSTLRWVMRFLSLSHSTHTFHPFIMPADHVLRGTSSVPPFGRSAARRGSLPPFALYALHSFCNFLSRHGSSTSDPTHLEDVKSSTPFLYIIVLACRSRFSLPLAPGPADSERRAAA